MGGANTLPHSKSLSSDVLLIPLSGAIKMVRRVEPFREVQWPTRVRGVCGAVTRGHVPCNIVAPPSGTLWPLSSQVRTSD